MMADGHSPGPAVMQHLPINSNYRLLGRKCVTFTDVQPEGCIPNAPLQKKAIRFRV